MERLYKGFSQDGEIASLRRNDKNSTFHDGQGLPVEIQNYTR